MAYDENKSSAELQRELEQQRSRVESTIDQIQAKLSPGQLIDELLAYTKGGGGEFVSSLQRNVTANPLPVALLGVSVAWLIAKPAPAYDADWDASINRSRGYGLDEDFDDEDYPVATITGYSMQRVGRAGAGDGGESYSEFIDDAGRKFRARSDAEGKRAGHFIDETGNRFKGFVDAAGQRIEQFNDEAGNLLDEATGWASHTWQQARERMHGVRDVRGRAGATASNVMGQVGSLNETVIHQLREQPLVGGALAFALGAALGSALPHTEQEDAVLGEASDAVKAAAAEQAASLHEQGREKAAELHEALAEKSSEFYQQARDGAERASEDRRG